MEVGHKQKQLTFELILSIPDGLINWTPDCRETSATPYFSYHTIHQSQGFCPIKYYPQTKTPFPRRLVLLTRPDSEKPLVNNSCKVSLFNSFKLNLSLFLLLSFLSLSVPFLLYLWDDLDLIKRKDFEVRYLVSGHSVSFLLWWELRCCSVVTL